MNFIRNIFKNKIIVAILCFIVAFIIAFIIVPKQDKKGQESIVKVKKTISENTQITNDMLKTIDVSSDSIPDGAIKDKNQIIDKYAKTNLYSSDFITEEKLSSIETESKLYSLKDGETAISITTKTLSKSVSGKLLVGDAVKIYGYDAQEKTVNTDSGKWSFEVLAIDNSKSENVSGTDTNTVSDIVPATITIKAVSDEQVRSIINMENNNDIQVVFVGRGELADKLLGLN